MKLIKFIILLPILIGSNKSYSSNEEEAAKIFAKEYSKQQLKFQLANYLNKNPHIVFSDSPKIGTESLAFIGKMLAAYSLLTANTDKEKGWAAIQLIVSPEPTTAMIILAVQIADILVTLEHNKNLHNTYAETARIQAERVGILTKVYAQDYNWQRGMIERVSELTESIDKQIVDLRQSQAYMYINNLTSEEPSDKEITFALHKLYEVSQRIFDLEVAKIYLDRTVDLQSLGLSDELILSLDMYLEGLLELKKRIELLQPIFQSAFTSSKGLIKFQIMKNKNSMYKRQLQSYERCVEVTNRVLTEKFWSQNKHYEMDHFYQDCQEHMMALY